MSMTNTFEGRLFIDASTQPTVRTADYAAQLFPTLADGPVNKVAQLYASVGTPFDQVIAIMGEGACITVEFKEFQVP